MIMATLRPAMSNRASQTATNFDSLASMLFAASEPGAWYDPSDLSTMWQDSAGTTPVTAVEQPVGLILDKSGRGNHATQSTSTKRPTYSRRVNLLTKTEQFDDVAWVKDAGTVTPNAYTSPTGRVFAKYTPDGTNVGSHRVRQTITLPTVAHTLSFEVKAAGYTGIKLRATNAWVNFNLTTETVGNSLNVSSPTITALGDGVYRVSGTFSVGAVNAYIYVDPGNTPSSDTNPFAGDGTSGIYISAASVTTAIDAHLPYQWVNTATDYDADPNEFPAFGWRDGVDDSLSSSTGGGGAAGFFFSSIVTPLGSAGTNRTLFSDAGTNTGYIVRLNTSNQLELSAGNGTAYTTIATSGTLAVGATDVVQAWDDGTNLNVKIGNGLTSSVARPAVAAGTAGYTLGQDNGASTGYFNGRSYSEIYRKDSGLTQSQREAVAVYQRQKARTP